MSIPGKPPQHIIAIVNQSAHFQDDDGDIILQAIKKELPHFCKDWGQDTITAEQIPKGKSTNTILKVYLLDKTDIRGTQGQHHHHAGIPFARVFVKTILDHSGTILFSPDATVPCVATCISHEIFDMLPNLRCNIWWMLPDQKTLQSAEAADPVEGNRNHLIISGKHVSLSDQVTPAWADPGATKGPQNRMNTLKAPFELAKKGYIIKTSTSTPQQQSVFGMTITPPSN